MKTLQPLVTVFLESCPPNFNFPLGGEVAIPQPSESCLLNYLLAGGGLTSADIVRMRKELARNDAYSLAIFAARMAVLSLERKQKELLESSFWALVVDDDRLDWRDVLVSLSIVEDCLLGHNGDIAGLIRSHAEIATERRKKIVLGYLKRRFKMRSVEIMGYKAVQVTDGRLH